MDDLHLSETEQRYFGDLFVLCCDTEYTDKVPLYKACELFRTSKVPPDVIKQVIMKWFYCIKNDHLTFLFFFFSRLRIYVQEENLVI